MFQLGRGSGYTHLILAEMPCYAQDVRARFGPAVIHSQVFDHKWPGWVFRDLHNNETVELAIIRGKMIAALPDIKEVPETAERFLAFVCSLK